VTPDHSSPDAPSPRPEAGPESDGRGERDGDDMRAGSGGTSGAKRRPGGIWTLVAAFALVNAMLLGPWWLAGGDFGRVWIALEAGVLVGLVALLPRRRWSAWVAGVGAAMAGAATLLIVGDATARQSLSRPLNLYLDVQLVPSVLHLLQGTLGPVQGTAAFAGAAALLVGATVLLGWLLVRLTRAAPWGAKAPGGAKGVARIRRWLTPVLGVLLLAACIPPLLGVSMPVLGLGRGYTERPAWVVVDQQRRHLARMLDARERFEREMADAPDGYADTPGLLARLEGRDVVLAFVESYGISALADPRYGPVVSPRLEARARRLEDAGLHVATGALVSPTQGGQSWLAHASLLSGLWVDDQLRYDVFLASDRETLIDDLRRIGHRPVAVMPAITLAWPEGARYGYDRIWARGDIDYRGPALNWVTMPDQFTWSFLETDVRPAVDRPLFAELGLISSHAPWTPVLPVLDDWDAIGDGRIFERWAGAGETPQELWRDPERVREQYPRSVAYAVDVGLAWAERFLDEGGLLLLMGDHQPAPLITGDDASRAVPVHVVSADSTLVAPFVEWGFRWGVLPDSVALPRRMDAFRPWFVESFSGTSALPDGSKGE